MKQGKVWLVGAGPGDGGLLTCKGYHVLTEQAQVVVYDSLVGQEILALIPPHVETIDVGKRAGSHPVPQHEINQILLEQAQVGKQVVRLKGGDPFLFGRGGEELELLIQNHIPFEIVPGVTSAVAVPAYAGIPVTHRDYASSVHIITGHKKQGGILDVDFPALAKLHGTLVFLMGLSNVGAICDGLMQAGMDGATPTAVLQQGTTARQRRVVSTLNKLAEEVQAAGILPPAIIVVGRVCALADTLHWAEDRTLGGCRVVVTRPRERQGTLSIALRELGAEVLELPTISTQAIRPNETLRQAVKFIEGYQVIAFTSPKGVEVFFDLLREWKVDVRRLAGIRLAAIGPGTAKALQERGLMTDLMPEEYNGAALGELLAENVRVGERILLPRAQEGSPELTDILQEEEIPFEEIPIYETVMERNELLSPQAVLGADCFAFTSASAVRGLAAAMGQEHLKGKCAVCIGWKTAAEAQRLCMTVHVAKEATIPSLIEAIVQVCQNNKSVC